VTLPVRISRFALAMYRAAEERLGGLPWNALRGLAPALDAPLAEVLAGAPAAAVLARVLRSLPGLGAEARAAVAEAVLGVALWRRRLRVQLGGAGGPPRLLLAALIRDLAGREDAAALCSLPADALPPPRPPPEDLADRFSLPDWLADELRAAARGDAEALADALDLPGPVCLRPNPLRTTPAALAARLASEGVATRPGRLASGCLVVTSPRPNVYGLAAHRDGLFEVQDEASQLAGAVLGVRPGEEVLDPCAGAGGKTLLLAAAVGSGGKVHAADPDGERLVRLRHRAARAGAAGIVLVHGPRAPAGLAVDRALVDAPCSELGALRRGPDARWRLDPSRFAALPALQLEILARAARHVRPGGALAYATCTFRRDEDEGVALAFEAAEPDFERITPDAPRAVVTPEGFLRTWPHLHGTDAFFAAVWRRR
jgi:16S rRNA (cytosine967-C5)-methyltransferase